MIEEPIQQQHSVSEISDQDSEDNKSTVLVATDEEDEEKYFTDPEDIIDLARLSDSVIRVSPTPRSGGDSSLTTGGGSGTPGFEPSKAELLRSVSYLEAELQAADATIAALQADRARLVFYQAKYGRFGLADSFNTALKEQPSASTKADEAAEDSSQLGQLENLIDTQRRAHLRMTDQIMTLRGKLEKASHDLVDERRKHELDSAEGDDVLAGLGKERERLLIELEFERANTRKLEKEMKRQLRALGEIKAANVKQRTVALEQIRQRKQATEQLADVANRCRCLEAEVRERRRPAAVKTAEAEAEAAAAREKERAELRRRIDAEREAADRLAQEVEELRSKLAAASAPPSQNASSSASPTPTASSVSASPSSSSSPSSLSSSSATRPRGAKPEPPVRRTPELTQRPAAAAVGTPKIGVKPAAAAAATTPSTFSTAAPAQQQQQQSSPRHHLHHRPHHHHSPHHTSATSAAASRHIQAAAAGAGVAAAASSSSLNGK